MLSTMNARSLRAVKQQPESQERPIALRSWVEDPRFEGRLRISLTVDGEVLCPDLDGYEAERDRLLAKMKSGVLHEGKGAPELGALVAAIPDIFHPYFGIRKGVFEDAFTDVYRQYQMNKVFDTAWRAYRAEHVDPREALLHSTVGQTVYWRFDEEDDGRLVARKGPADIAKRMVYHFDQPIETVAGQLVGAGVYDTYWEIPIAKGWKEQVHDAGLTVVSGKLVVGRDPDDASVLYAIAKRDGAFWVRAFRYDARRRNMKVIADELLCDGRPQPGVVPLRTREQLAKDRSQARRKNPPKRKPRKHEEEIPFVVCEATGHDEDLDELPGTLFVDYEDDRPMVATFDPDDESIPSAELEVVRWARTEEAVRVHDEEGKDWVFHLEGDEDDDEEDEGDGHPFNATYLD